MDDLTKTKAELLRELENFCRRIAELEAEIHHTAHLEPLASDPFRLYDRLQLGYQSLDSEGVIVELNQMWLDLLGYSRESAVGHFFEDFLAPEDRSAFRDRFPALKETGGVRNVCFHLLRGDGTTARVEFNSIAEYDVNGEFVRTHCILRDLTELEKTVEVLSRSEARYRAIVEDQTQLICRFKPDFTLTYVNEAYCRYFDKTADDLIGVNFLTLIPEDYHPVVLAHFGQIGPDNPVAIHEHQVLNPKGELCWQHWINHALYDPSGRLTEYQSVGWDITKRKNAELALREERSIFIGGPTVVVKWRAGEDWPIEYISPNVETQFGYKAEDFIAGRVSYPNLIHPDDLAKVSSDQNSNNQNDSEYFEQEYRLRHADGVYRWVYDFTVVSRDGSGRIAAFLGYILDISDRKQIEEELRESETKYRSLVENTLQGVVIFQNGRFVFANQAMKDITGYSPEELTSPTMTNPFCLIHPDDRDLVASRIRDRLAGKVVPSPYRVRTIAKDGAVHWVDFSGVKIEYGGKPAIIAAFYDVTDQVTSERQEHAFEERMRQSQKMESLGILAGGIAHDFNNILAAVLGNTELAMMELPPDSPILYYLEQIRLSSNRAARITDQMLMYSGGGRFAMQPVNCNLIIRELAPILETIAATKINLRYELDESIPEILGSSTQIPQAVINLVTNAAEAMGGNQGSITIRTGVESLAAEYFEDAYASESLPGGDYAHIQIADTGSGMDQETFAKIFDPFFSSKFVGRGLGLAAVLGVMRGHRGAVKVHSEPGKGSTFKLLFPVIHAVVDGDIITKS